MACGARSPRAAHLSPIITTRGAHLHTAVGAGEARVARAHAALAHSMARATVGAAEWRHRDGAVGAGPPNSADAPALAAHAVL